MRLLSAVFMLLMSFVLNAQNTVTQEQISSLSQQEQWRHLLHYHQAGLFSPYQSQVDDSGFFLAEDGSTNPEAELAATISALQSTPEIQCTFPARAHWIKSQLPELQIPEESCPDFNAWFHKIDGESLTLIFPAAYLNSPSSMYGHTLIRIDRKHGSNPLLDYSVNYAANADPDDNEIVFSYKGLTGGYPGVFSVLPYYEKVNEYSYLEARDVWEYKLNLNKEELDQFLRHTWEIKDSHFDYYFFTENCSYHLLTILDAASERFDLSDEFYASAIPADTVRVVSDADLIEEAVFRPSKLNLMLHLKDQLSDDQVQQAKAIVDDQQAIDDAMSGYNENEQAKILELAYQYSRYLSVRKKEITKARNEQAIKLLSARSKLPVGNDVAPYPTPTTRDDQGHSSRRVQLSYGEVEEDSYIQAGLRMAYHDFLDPIPGYIKGAQLEMFHLQFRSQLEGQKQTRVEKIGLLDISSYSAINELVQPLSWRVSTGFERELAISSELMPYLSTGFGYSARLENHLVYGLGNVDFNLDSDLEKGYRFDLGPRLGWLYQADKVSLGLTLTQPFNLGGADFKQRDIAFGAGVNLSKDMQLRFESTYTELSLQETLETEHLVENKLSVLVYF